MLAPHTRGRLGPRNGVEPYVAAAPAPPAAPAILITALPVEANIDAYEGDDLFVDVTVNNPDGSATDLSTATVMAQVRTAPGARDILANFTVSVMGNVIHLQLPAAQAALLTPLCAWDCQLTLLNQVTTLAAWAINTTTDVSR